MTIPTWMKTNIKRVVYAGTSLLVLFLLYQAGTRLFTRMTHYQEVKSYSVCPSLLSITRSARDTLIVMKAEPLCNKFVLDSLR